MGVDTETLLLSVAELESETFEQAVFGPLLGVVEADVDLTEKSIRKRGKDLVLGLVSGCVSVLILKCASDRPEFQAGCAGAGCRILSSRPMYLSLERTGGQGRLYRKDFVLIQGGACEWLLGD